MLHVAELRYKGMRAQRNIQLAESIDVSHPAVTKGMRDSGQVDGKLGLSIRELLLERQLLTTKGAYKSALSAPASVSARKREETERERDTQHMRGRTVLRTYLETYRR